jgi:hypothetical protein
MRQEIIRFLKDICAEFGLSANYIAQKNMYILHKRGFAIQNFTADQFYQIPHPARRTLIIGILKRGLTHNLGEKQIKEKLNINSQVGIRIC